MDTCGTFLKVLQPSLQLLKQFPLSPLSVGNEKIRGYEEILTLRGERDVSPKLDGGCSFLPTRPWFESWTPRHKCRLILLCISGKNEIFVC